MEEFDLPHNQPEPKRFWLNDSEKAKLIAAFLALLAAVLNIFGRSQKATWALAVGTGILLVVLVVPVAKQALKRLSQSRRNWRFIEVEHEKLERYLRSCAAHLCRIPQSPRCSARRIVQAN
jgi:small-conductance mechanosensitive channel